MKVFNVKSYGAAGDGSQDDAADILSAMRDATEANGALYFPAGDYLCGRPIILEGLRSRFAMFGDGPNISRVRPAECSGMRLAFEQSGIQQPFGLVMRGLGFKARGAAGDALSISYGQPAITNDHYRPAVAMSDIQIESSDDGSFANGLVLEGAWNPTLRNIFISGSAHGGNWDNLSGVGLQLRGMCVNAKLSNVDLNFWQTGLMAHGSPAGNTEGIFAENCSMVGVQRGAWIAGTPGNRISTFNWRGGLVECRFSGVRPDKGKAAFHLQNVWTALIGGTQMISDTIDLPDMSYGVIPQDCHGVVVSGCDINAFKRGFLTTGDCRGMNVNGNTFTNTPKQVHFGTGTIRSRSYGNTCVNNNPDETDDGENNRMGFL